MGTPANGELGEAAGFGETSWVSSRAEANPRPFLRTTASSSGSERDRAPSHRRRLTWHAPRLTS